MRYLMVLLFVWLFKIPVAAQDCPDMPPLAFTPNSTGRVTPDYNNRLRDNPSTTATVIASIPAGASFTVTGEAQCADGYRWWPVTWEGQSGWTAEGEDGDYFLTVTAIAPVPEVRVLDITNQIDMYGYGTPSSTAWSGSIIAVLTDAGILIYDTADLDAEPVFLPPQSDIFFSMALNPANPNQLIATDGGKNLWSWDIATRQATLLRSEVTDPRFSPDGGTIIVRSGPSYLMLDAATGAEKQTFSSEAQNAFMISEDATRVAVDVGDNIRIRDLNGALITEVENTVFTPYLFDQNRLFGSEWTGYMYIQSLETGEIQTFEPAEPDTPTTELVSDALFLPDGRLLTAIDSAWGYAGIALWNPDDISAPLQTISLEPLTRIANLTPSPDFSQMAAIAFHRDESRSLIILDAESYEVVYESAPFPAMDTLVASEVSIAYSPKAGEITVRDIESGEMLHTLTYNNNGHPTHMTFSDDGDLLVFCSVPVGSMDWSPVVFGFSLKESTEGSIWLDYYLPDDYLLCSWITYDEGYRNFFVNGYNGLYGVLGEAKPFQSPGEVEGEKAYVRGDTLWMVGTEGIYKADLTTGEMTQVVDSLMDNQISFYIPTASDMHGELIVLNGGTNATALYVYDAAKDEQLYSIQTESQIYSIAFSADGTSFATGHDNGQILRWNTADGKPLGQVGRIAGRVMSLVFSTDRLYSAGEDSVIRVWSVK